MPSSTTAEILRNVIAESINLDVDELRRRVGHIVLTTSDDGKYQELLRRAYHPSTVMALYEPGDVSRDASTIFLVDRIPAGIEKQVVLREIAQKHAWNVKPGDWSLLVRGVKAWDTWGGIEGRIFRAVSQRIERTLGLPGRDKALVVFALQEAVDKKIEPDLKGIGVSGWLQAVFDTLRESMIYLTGNDLAGHGPEDFVRLLQFGTPFKRQIDALEAAERLQREEQQRISARARRMEALDAKFAAAGEAAPGAGREAVLLERIAELTENLRNAKFAIKSMASQGHDDRWYASCYLNDDVTSLVTDVEVVKTMRSALWDIKELVVEDLVISVWGLGDVESLAYLGLETGVGTAGERAALKSILASVQRAADARERLDKKVVLDVIAASAPLLLDATVRAVARDEAPGPGM